jgi:hypothetical protein
MAMVNGKGAKVMSCPCGKNNFMMKVWQWFLALSVQDAAASVTVSPHSTLWMPLATLLSTLDEGAADLAPC